MFSTSQRNVLVVSEKCAPLDGDMFLIFQTKTLILSEKCSIRHRHLFSTSPRSVLILSEKCAHHIIEMYYSYLGIHAFIIPEKCANLAR